MNPIGKAQKDKARLASLYDVPISAIVWIGGNEYIIVKDGVELKVEANSRE